MGSTPNFSQKVNEVLRKKRNYFRWITSAVSKIKWFTEIIQHFHTHSPAKVLFIYLFFHNMMTSSKRSIKTFSYDYYHQTKWRCLLSLKNKKISREKNCKINLIIKQSYFLWKLISKKQNKSQDNFNEFFWIIRILWPKTLQIWIKRVQF